MTGHSNERMFIVLTLVASNWTFLFRNPMHVCASMLLLYIFWFILIDSAHEISFLGGYDVLAILMGAALGQYLPTVLHLTKFVPHTNLALAKQLDVWTHHVVYWPVFGLGSAATVLGFVWLNWHWQWAFMIVAVLFVALVVLSYVLVVGTLRHDVTTLHLAWLAMSLWQVLFYGAAQQIDPSVEPILWVCCLVVVPLVCLSFINGLMNVFWPPVNYSDPKNGIIVHDDAQTVFGNPYGDEDDDLVSEASSLDSAAAFRPSLLRRLVGYIRGENMTHYTSTMQMVSLQERMGQYRSSGAYDPAPASSSAAAAATAPLPAFPHSQTLLYPSTYYGPHAPVSPPLASASSLASSATVASAYPSRASIELPGF